MPGDGDGASIRGGHCFRRSVSVITTYAVPKAMVIAMTAPMTIAMAELASADHTRRNGLGRL